MNKNIEKLKEIINNSKNIVVFTGAGISVPSGIPDFRSSNGLYSEKIKGNISPETVVSHDFFMLLPDEFYNFYKSKMIYKNAKPNIAHKFFAELEKQGKVSVVITQNIDGLHQLAGSKNVLELHGSIYRNFCTKCHKAFDLDYILNSSGVPKCDKCGGVIKPDVVLYGEMLDGNVVSSAIKAIQNADTLIVVGTSLVVQPAASFVQMFKGENLVLINKSKTSLDALATLVINDDIEKVINQIIK